MDRGADARVAYTKPPFEQGLRAEGAEQRDLHQGGDDPPDTEAAGEGRLNLTKQALTSPPVLATSGDTMNRLVAPCNSMARSTLPRVCTKTQVKRTDFAGISTRSSQTGWWYIGFPSVQMRGRCHSAQSTPRIRLAARALCRDSSRGSANPRQASSSPRPSVRVSITKKRGSTTKDPSRSAGGAAAAHEPPSIT